MVLATFSHWFNLLKPKGTLRLAVPDFEAICRHYLETDNINDVIGLLYGGQNHPLNNHFIAFDFTSLKASLEKSGFVNVRKWDHSTTEHSQFDDYSQAYLPHMDRSGRLMSLNLEADKP